MEGRPFTHLHVHSHFSLLDGAGTLPALVKRTKELGMDALALTDHGNLYGALKFYKECTTQGIKPIIGYEAYLAPGHRLEKTLAPVGKHAAYYHITLLAMNNAGFKNLLKLATIAYTEGFYYKPRIDREILQRYNNGIICLSGCLAGEINQHLIDNAGPHTDKIHEIVTWYKKLFGDRFYLEIQNNGLSEQQRAGRMMAQLARDENIPLVATNDVHYVLREDAPTQDVLLCVNMGKHRTDTDRLKMDSDQFYLRSPEEMYAAFPGLEDAVAHTYEIAQRCDVTLKLKQRFFPVYKTPDNMTSVEYLRQLSMEGLRKRYANTPKRWKDELVGGELSEEVINRLNTEMDVITRQGFPNYFLIVWDFVREAHARNIECSARGSGVGSIVCFALGLSHVCPLEYDLLFERFLDVNREEAPDIDIDFDQQRRGEVLQYVKDHYGESNVAQIGTFGTLAAKAAIRDVGRVLSMPLGDVAKITAMVPEEPKITISLAMAQNPDLKKIYDNDPTVHELIDFALGCEGLARNTSTHACAVVITAEPVVDFVPLQVVKEGIVTQWEAPDVEEAGLLKMDFLGLRNLTILAQTVELINQTTGKQINPYDYPHDDKETYALLCRGETRGIFQLEGDGIRKLLQRMKPDNFRDIIATLALYRPGPLEGGLVDQYVNVKHGRQKAKYEHPVMEDVLTETHGVMVYQEQIMRILNRLGKIELADSYKCIKAISKKKEAYIAKYKISFLQGCMENGLTEQKGEEIFELINKFAGYGFNKSHSTAYAKVAYMTAYLKAHYPVEFMAALLTGDIPNRNFTKKDQTVEHLEDCTRMGIQVVPPDVNTSEPNFTVKDGKIYFGLRAIKGCSEGASSVILEERKKNGPFTNIFNFCERLDTRQVPRAVIETLIKAGAFNSLEGSRSQIMAMMDRAIHAGNIAADDRRKGQMNLFDMGDSDKEKDTVILPDIPEWTEKEILSGEKEVLGFYISSHPLNEFKDILDQFCTHRTVQARLQKHRTQIIAGGMIISSKISVTRNTDPNKPSRFAMFELEDQDGVIHCIIWPETFQVYSDLIHQDAVVVCVGNIDKRDPESEPTLIVDRVFRVDELNEKFGDGVMLELDLNKHNENTLTTLHEILRYYPGDMKVELVLHTSDHYRAVLKCPKLKVAIHPEMLDRLRAQIGASNVHVIIRKLEPQPEMKKKWIKKKS